MDLSHWIERNARWAPDRTAIRFEGEDLCYARLAREIDATAHALANLGVRESSVVAYLGLNHPLLLKLLFACAQLGSLMTPLNWRLAAKEWSHILDDCAPQVLVVEPPFVEALRTIAPARCGTCIATAGDCPPGWIAWNPPAHGHAPLPPERRVGGPDTPIVLCYTSGTTGTPKGVVLTQDAIECNAANSAHMHDLTSRDRVLTTLPMFHVGGLNIQTLPALRAGASVILHPRFSAEETLRTIAREQVTLTVLVPAQLNAILERPEWDPAKFASLRMISTGSTIVSEAFARRINALGVPLAQVYGSTETAPIAAYQRCEDAVSRPGSAGATALHCELRIVDDAYADVPPGVDGEILVRGRNVMCGYWNQPAQTVAAFRGGWFCSGDVGHLDADGFLYVVARKKDMIITGGENVYPEEVEALLLDDPAVLEVCVVGKPDERFGEMVVAAVVLRDGARLTIESVKILLEDRLARYKHPRELHFLPQMPRNALGKLCRADVRTAILSATTKERD
jgi:fatty-acyl-CoA synthase